MARAAISSTGWRTVVRVGVALEQRARGVLAAALGEVAVLDGVGLEPGRGHRLPPSLEAVDTGGHVSRTGDRADAPAAASDEHLAGLALAGGVVDVDVGHPVTTGPRPAAEDAGQAEVREVLGEAVVAVVGGDHGAVDVAVGEVAQGACGRRARVTRLRAAGLGT